VAHNDRINKTMLRIREIDMLLRRAGAPPESPVMPPAHP